VTLVMFGYRGVISSGPSEQDMTTMAGAAGVAVRRLEDAYWRPRPAYEQAELDAPAYWQQVGRLAGRGQPYTGAEVAELIRLDTDSWLHLQAGTVELIEELAAAGHRLAVLADAPSQIAVAMAELPVARYFEQLIFSCELKMSKLDAAFLAAALDRLGAATANVIFVDDRAGDPVAAAAAGLQTVRFTSPGQARELLAELLVCHIK
jgi:putative hydrolase of the HAD superfamily